MSWDTVRWCATISFASLPRKQNTHSLQNYLVAREQGKRSMFGSKFDQHPTTKCDTTRPQNHSCYSKPRAVWVLVGPCVVALSAHKFDYWHCRLRRCITCSHPLNSDWYVSQRGTLVNLPRSPTVLCGGIMTASYSHSTEQWWQWLIGMPYKEVCSLYTCESSTVAHCSLWWYNDSYSHRKQTDV